SGIRIGDQDRGSGSGPGGRALRGRAAGYGPVGDAGLRGSGLHGRATPEGCSGARSRVRSRPARRGEAGVRAAAAALGGGALVRVGGAVPAHGTGLRAVAGDGGGAASGRVRARHAGPGVAAPRRWSITRSRSARKAAISSSFTACPSPA